MTCFAFGFSNLVGDGKEIKELPNLHAVVNTESIRHVAHTLPHVHRVVCDIVSVDDTCAARGAQQGREKSNRRALTSAIGDR